MSRSTAEVGYHGTFKHLGAKVHFSTLAASTKNEPPPPPEVGDRGGQKRGNKNK